MHEPAADMVIDVREVTLALGETRILHGIDLAVARGESLALLGASGSGKSSLLAVLTGLERAGGGQVRVAGLDLGALDEDALAVAYAAANSERRPRAHTYSLHTCASDSASRVPRYSTPSMLLSALYRPVLSPTLKRAQRVHSLNLSCASTVG